MVGWRHWLDGHETEQTLGDAEGQGQVHGVAESDTTEWLSNIYRLTHRCACLHGYVYTYSYPSMGLYTRICQLRGSKAKTRSKSAQSMQMKHLSSWSRSPRSRTFVEMADSRTGSAQTHGKPGLLWQNHIWGYWHFSQQSWFQLDIHPAQHFPWYTLHISQTNRVTIYSLVTLLSWFSTSGLFHVRF